MENYTVYMHISPSGKRYVGITSVEPKTRWGNRGHNYKGQAFENAIKKYGWENIKHIILLTGLSKEEAESKEIELIARYKTTDKRYGYNVENGGKTVGRFTEETKRKISESHKGSIPWNKGIPRTEEEKRKMSLSHMGKTVGEKNGNYRRQFSEEHRRKISEAKKGTPSYWKGKHLTPHMAKRLKEANQKKIIRLEDLKVFDSVTEAGKSVGVTTTAISNCLHGKTKRAGGYHWKFAECD